jgi:hypothetical protein
MADAALPNPPHTTINSTGTVVVRERPAQLIMVVPMSAAEATLELALAKLKKQREAASQWVQRLNASRAEFGEVHFPAESETERMRRAALPRPAAKKRKSHERDVCMILTAMWDIAALSVEDALLFVDRLRFEAATDAEENEEAEGPPPWASPEEQIRSMMEQLAVATPEDRSPQFLYVARLSQEQLAKAQAEAFLQAQRSAEQLARAMGRSLGIATYVRCDFGRQAGTETRPEAFLKRQRCASLLAGSFVELQEHDQVSDDSRSASFAINVHMTYQLDPAR